MLERFKKFSLPEIEEKVLRFWKEDQIFEKSVAKNRPKSYKPKAKSFVFYEGPPTANGRPGIHHVLARSFKDIVLRYKTMAGFFVPRRGGWDTHGLPVELEVEKELGLKSKQEIEKFGIAEFNRKCRESVWRYKGEWERLTDRIGFWLDMRYPYITYENSYIETLWWIISEIAKKKLLYKGHKVVPWCPRCGTALSSHELALGYREVEDASVYVKFKLKENQKVGNWKTGRRTYILSWTTTPWTLPGNVALAVGKDIEYVTMSVGSSTTLKGKDEEVLITPGIYILAKDIFWKNMVSNAGLQNALRPMFKDLRKLDADVRLYLHDFNGFAKEYNIAIIQGKDLVDLEYEPLFSVRALKSKNSYKVYPADFVNIDEGTGVVHTAVMYGEDDYDLGKKIGLPQHHTVDEQGKFTKDVSVLAGMYVKSKKTEEKIFQHLKTHNLLLKTEAYTHEYPFCWRCDEPLLYYARDSWFIAMSKLRTKLLAANKSINWVPEYLKEGRFGEWLRGVKDWNFSRERYWGTPLPVWECTKCDRTKVIDSREELSKRTGRARNQYFFLRHGEALNNVKNILNSALKDKDKYSLTLKGKIAAEKTGKKLKKENIDIIFASDFRRAKETARIVADILGIKNIVFDKRLRENDVGIFSGKHISGYRGYFSSYSERFSKRPPKGETMRDVVRRSFDFVSSMEKKYNGKRILVVTHEDVVWACETAMRGWSEEESILEKKSRKAFLGVGEFRRVPFFLLPRDENGFADFHRPYIDNVVFSCSESSCRGTMRRVKEVIDAWFDSGAMPFAQAHWPFAQTKNLKLKTKNPGIDFPADYIVEGLDQTRGWFYTLLAVSVLLERGASYKNVISHGLVLDERGQKMSKSRGNVVDPWEVIGKYGADAVRWYFYTVNPPGEPKQFDVNEIAKVSRRFISLLYNSFVFFDTYAGKIPNPKPQTPKSKNVLDGWIIARLNETILKTTQDLDAYEIGEAARAIEAFANDLSRWYIRRSRRRLQRPENKKDYEAASATLGHVLFETSKLLAPFTPFFSEALYKSLVKDHKSSVHLEDWPKTNRKLINRKLLSAMEEVRRLASLALAERAEKGIKVRQPLSELRVSTLGGKNRELLEILKEEVNVKKIVFNRTIKNEIELDMEITHKLKEEGWLREFMRIVQGLRQDAGLEPKDRIVLMVELSKELQHVVSTSEEFIKKEVGALRVEYKRSSKFDIELETKLDEWPIWVALRRVAK